jgi:type I restriction enzyme M protein
MNLYLHDIETFAIRRGDTLRDPKFREPDCSLSRFDAVIANPPFSLKAWGRAAWADDPFGRAEFGVPPEAYADFAFVEHMVASMQPTTGRIAVVMPHGVLFREQSEQVIRRRLIESGSIEAIIRLPRNLFYSTSIPACVMVLRETQQPEGISYIDAAAQFAKGRNQNEMLPEHVARVVTAYLHGGAEALPTRLVSHAEIAAQEYNLGFDRYLAAEELEEVSVEETLSELADARMALAEACDAFDAALEEAGLA